MCCQLRVASTSRSARENTPVHLYTTYSSPLLLPVWNGIVGYDIGLFGDCRTMEIRRTHLPPLPFHLTHSCTKTLERPSPNLQMFIRHQQHQSPDVHLPDPPAAGINQQWYYTGYGGKHLQWTNQSRCHHLTDGNFTDGHQVWDTGCTHACSLSLFSFTAHLCYEGTTNFPTHPNPANPDHLNRPSSKQ